MIYLCIATIFDGQFICTLVATLDEETVEESEVEDEDKDRVGRIIAEAVAVLVEDEEEAVQLEDKAGGMFAMGADRKNTSDPRKACSRYLRWWWVPVTWVGCKELLVGGGRGALRAARIRSRKDGVRGGGIRRRPRPQRGGRKSAAAAS